MIARFEAERQALAMMEHANSDGNRLFSNGSDGTVRIYDATPLPERP